MIQRTVLIGALALGLAAPAAQAVDFNVSTTGELTSALSTAASNGSADRIFMAAGTYTGPFSYAGGEDLQIIGAGEGQTVISDTGSGDTALDLENFATYSVSGLTLSVGASASRGLELRGGGTVDHVTVDMDPSTFATGLSIEHAATLQHITVLGHGSGGVGVYDLATAATMTLTDSSFTGADVSVYATAQATIDAARLKISAPGGYAVYDLAGTIDLSDSLIDLGTGLGVVGLMGTDGNDTGHGYSVAIDASRVTIAGSGGNGQYGAEVTPNSTGDNFTIALHDSLEYQVSLPLACNRPSGHGTGSVTADYSSLDASGDYNGTCGSPFLITHPVTNTGLQLADPAHGDFRPLFNSPLVDAGDPAALAATTDLAGGTRPVDGDGNGSAVRDVGAYEYQRAAPAISAAGAQPTSANTGDSITFSATASDTDPGETATLSWAFDDGAVASGSPVSHAFTTAGSHTATVTATDSAGVTSTQQVMVTVTTPAPDPGTSTTTTPSTDSPPPADTTTTSTTPAPDTTTTITPGPATDAARALVLGAVRIRGAMAFFTLSAGATVHVRLERRVGRRWRAVRRSIALAGHSGANAVRIPARLLRGLPPGRYRATCVATDAGGHTSAARRVTFTIRR